MRKLKQVWESLLAYGTTGIVLAASLVIVLTIILLSTFVPSLVPQHISAAFSRALILLFLAELLYARMIERFCEEPTRESGIIGCTDGVHTSLIESFLNNTGRIFILNTWVYNLSEITPLIKSALIRENTTVELTILALDAEMLDVRAKELGLSEKEMKNAISVNRTEIAKLLRELPETQLCRVRIFQTPIVPKFSVYAVDRDAIVGFYMPSVFAIHGPQVRITGRTGCFAKAVWQYIDGLHREDITEQLTTDR